MASLRVLALIEFQNLGKRHKIYSSLSKGLFGYVHGVQTHRPRRLRLRWSREETPREKMGVTRQIGWRTKGSYAVVLGDATAPQSFLKV